MFPIRLGVEPEILLPPEHGIPHQLLLPTLHSPARSWSGYLRGSPTRLQKEDAEVILDAIQRAKQTPVLRPFDKRMAERVPVATKGTAITRQEEVPPGQPALSTRILGLFYKAVSREVFVFSVVNRLLVRGFFGPR